MREQSTVRPARPAARRPRSQRTRRNVPSATFLQEPNSEPRVASTRNRPEIKTVSAVLANWSHRAPGERSLRQFGEQPGCFVAAITVKRDDGPQLASRRVDIAAADRRLRHEEVCVFEIRRLAE